MNKYIIRKVIIAGSIKQAIRLEKNAAIEEILKDQTYTHPKKEKMGFEAHDKKRS